MRVVGCLWIVMIGACSSNARDATPALSSPVTAAPGDARIDDAPLPTGDGGSSHATADSNATFRMATPPDPSTFQYDPTADTNNTAAGGEVELSPRVLVALLGAPYVSDPTKVSGQYVFKAGKRVFTVYEWESTQNSDEGCGPMPAVFWMTDRPYQFHVGGPLDATKDERLAFAAWLRAQVSTMLRKQHAKNIAALEKLVAQLADKTLTAQQAAAAARALRGAWKLGPVSAKQITQPLTVQKRKLDKFENWSTGGGKPCDPFVRDSDEGKPPAVEFGREDPRSIWQEVLRAIVEDAPKPEHAQSLKQLLAAKPGEEWNAWEAYAPTR